MKRVYEAAKADDALAALMAPPSPRCDMCGVSGVIPGPNGGHRPCPFCDRGREKMRATAKGGEG